MFLMHQNSGRFAKSAVSAWCGRNKLGPGRRFVSEDAAMREACERLSHLYQEGGIRPDPNEDLSTHRHGSGGLTIRSRGLDVSFVIRST